MFRDVSNPNFSDFFSHLLAHFMVSFKKLPELLPLPRGFKRKNR